MNSYFYPLWQMTIASIKMYFRDFTALFFSLIFPVLFLLVFGAINNQADLKLRTQFFNYSDTSYASRFEEALLSTPIFEIDSDKEYSLDEAKTAVSEGELNFIAVLDEQFGTTGEGEIPSGSVELFINEGDQNFASTIESVVTSIAEQFNSGVNEEALGQAPLRPFTVSVNGVNNEDLTGIDYVVPGIIAFSLMSLGIFSIAQGFIFYKSSGALKRLFVAPIHPLSFIVAQTVTRLLLILVNVWSMLLIAYWLFGFTMVGDIINFTLVSLVGGVLFLGIGFAIAGWAKNENQAAPLANIIFFPMMFLSGTFFPREVFGDTLAAVSDFLPLSYLADGLRLVANNGATVFSLGGEMLGMLVWTVIVYIVAVRVFRWE